MTVKDGVRLKGRLPVIPRERKAGECIASREIYSGGDTYDTSRGFLDCVYRLDSCPGVGQIKKHKEVSRLFAAERLIAV